MLRILLSVLLLNLSAFCISARAQSQPDSLIGFLKPGMHVRILFSPNSSAVTIDVYSDEQYAIAIDAQSMSANELSQKYPTVAKRRDDLIEKHVKKLSGENASTSSSNGKEIYAVVHTQGRSPSQEFCKVLHIGNDYALVQYSEGNRQVIAKSFIKTIRLDMQLSLRVTSERKD